MKFNYTQRYKRFDREVLSFLRKDMKQVRQAIKTLCNKSTHESIQKDLSALHETLKTKERTYTQAVFNFNETLSELLRIRKFDDIFDSNIVINDTEVFYLRSGHCQVIPYISIPITTLDKIASYLLAQNKQLNSVPWTAGNGKEIYGVGDIPDSKTLQARLLQKELNLIEPMSCEEFINHSDGYFDESEVITEENLETFKSDYLIFMEKTLKQLSQEELLERQGN